MAVTIGSDPEFFVFDQRTGGVKPACGLFGGTKGAAIPIPGMDEGYGYQEDNVMLEFNVPPSTSGRMFGRSIISAMQGMHSLIRTTDPNLGVDNACSRMFSFDELSHPKSREFGCSPDFTAYMQGQPIEPIPLKSLEEDGGAWRFAGGHIHIGYNNKDVPHFVAAAFADVFIGLSAVDWDIQGMRRKYYGTAGRFRPTPYGIEYRTLSNKWVFHNDALQRVGASAMRLGLWLERTPLGVIQSTYLAMPWGDIRAAIETEDSMMAARLEDDVDRLMRRGE